MAEHKISANDPFDFEWSMRGFRIQINTMFDDIFTYQSSFTFSGQYMGYYEALKEQYTTLRWDDDFFLHTEDPWVIHSLVTKNILLELRDAVELYFKMKPIADDTNRSLAESERMCPFFSCYGYKKPYEQLKPYYLRTLISHVEYLYNFASVFTARKYRIPRVFKKKFNISDPESLYLLDNDQLIVQLLKKTIVQLIPHLEELKKMSSLESGQA